MLRGAMGAVVALAGVGAVKAEAVVPGFMVIPRPDAPPHTRDEVVAATCAQFPNFAPMIHKEAPDHPDGVPVIRRHILRFPENPETGECTGYWHKRPGITYLAWEPFCNDE